ncbi:Sectered polysaccharide deacetylase [Deinococcus sp. HMF7620]|uniref:Sectered polysaccharide deacetylase n=1 Tax=Deinococcus arboris TaxID=2682977 RepID=A0A7C9M1H2_9DEIO|nr:Sectered polysaccharide deacetylase [Deinococcus arboris]MVN86682.1 Sectered polysaccharide deacetylase [Deinococcus arboris]
MSAAPPRSLLLRAALHAGLGGAQHGGHPGDPRVGLAVPVASGADLTLALTTLAQAGVHATLLLSPALALRAPDAVQAAADQHEIGGLGDPAGLSGLEVTAGRPVTLWATPERLRGLSALSRQHLHALPVSALRAAPGALLQVAPAELAAALTHLKALGYQPVPVRDVPDLRPGQPRDLLQRVYTRLVEDRFARQHAVIDLALRADAVMRVAALNHAPPPLPLPPQTPTAELHLHSPRIVGLAARSALVAYRAYRRSLKDVAHALQTRPELADAQAVFAVTLFHGPLAQAGFELLDLPPLRARWYGLGFRLLRAAYGTRRAPSEGEPKMAWLSREAFLKLHG